MTLRSVVLLGALWLAVPAPAHVLYGRTTLRQWIAQSPVVAVVEFESDAQMWRADDASDRQEYFRVRALETLRGEAPSGSFEFFPHAEGFPGFHAGDRALLFLEPTSERVEFTTLAARFPWFSAQSAGSEWTLAGVGGERILAVARRWSSLRETSVADPAGAMRAILLAALGSGVARLQDDAIAELVGVRALPGVLEADGVAAFAALADAPELGLTHRLALVRLLEGAPGFDAQPRLRALAHEAGAQGSGLSQMIRVAGASDDPELRTWLGALAEDPRPWVRREALAALGR